MTGQKTTVAVIGGTGLLGAHLVNGLLANGHYDVTIVTRKDTAASKLETLASKGAKVAHVDPSDHASLVAGLKGHEVVISALASTALAEQPKYIEAAKEAGVRRFVPSEFGIDTGAPGIREYFPAMGYKYAVRDLLEASGLEYTYYITGFFLESTFGPYFGFDIANAKVTLKGDSSTPFTLTSLVDVGVWVAETLLLPSSKNASVYLSGETITLDQAVATIEHAKGKKFEVSRVAKEELDKQIADAPDVWSSFMDLLLRAVSDGRALVPQDHIYKSATHTHPLLLASYADKL